MREAAWTGKSEGRNPKAERSPKVEARRPKVLSASLASLWLRVWLRISDFLRASDFGFRISREAGRPSFGFRISDFGFRPCQAEFGRRRKESLMSWLRRWSCRFGNAHLDAGFEGIGRVEDDVVGFGKAVDDFHRSAVITPDRHIGQTHDGSWNPPRRLARLVRCGRAAC